jgi:hypothetical protein
MLPPYRIARRDGRWRISVAGADLLDCACYGQAIACVARATRMLAPPALPDGGAPRERPAASAPAGKAPRAPEIG